MKNMKTLIDKAAKVCGNDQALAIRMGVKPNVISMLRHGRTITPETAAELADIAGEDAREAAIAAILERAKGTRREGVLREVLGKGVAAGVAALCLFSYSGDSISAMEKRAKVNKDVNSLYIVEYSTRQADNAGKSRLARKVAEPACGFRTLFQRCSRFTICRWLAVCGRLPQ